MATAVKAETKTAPQGAAEWRVGQPVPKGTRVVPTGHGLPDGAAQYDQLVPEQVKRVPLGNPRVTFDGRRTPPGV